MADNQQIRFSGEGDQEPDLEPGDIVIVLDEKEHSTFQRKGMHLFCKVELELVEALCGFQKTIKTLDDRVLVISCLPGEVIKPNELKVVRGEGMPMYKNPFEKGNLIIDFTLTFPKNNFIAPDKIAELEKYLPPRVETMIPDDAEEHTLQDFDPQANRQQRRAGTGMANFYEEDDDMEDQMGGQRVQCASH